MVKVTETLEGTFSEIRNDGINQGIIEGERKFTLEETSDILK